MDTEVRCPPYCPLHAVAEWVRRMGREFQFGLHGPSRGPRSERLRDCWRTPSTVATQSSPFGSSTTVKWHDENCSTDMCDCIQDARKLLRLGERYLDAKGQRHRMAEECKHPPCQHAEGMDLVLSSFEQAMED